MGWDNNGGEADAGPSADAPLYVAKSHWLIKALVSPVVIIVAAALLNPSEVAELWAASNWLFRAALLFVGACIPVGLMQTFVQKTEFGPRGIRHRNWLGRRTTWKYDEVDTLKYQHSHLDIILTDRRKLRIWRSMGDLLRILQIVRRRSGDLGRAPTP